MRESVTETEDMLRRGTKLELRIKHQEVEKRGIHPYCTITLDDDGKEIDVSAHGVRAPTSGKKRKAGPKSKTQPPVKHLVLFVNRVATKTEPITTVVAGPPSPTDNGFVSVPYVNLAQLNPTVAQPISSLVPIQEPVGSVTPSTSHSRDEPSLRDLQIGFGSTQMDSPSLPLALTDARQSSTTDQLIEPELPNQADAVDTQLVLRRVARGKGRKPKYQQVTYLPPTLRSSVPQAAPPLTEAPLPYVKHRHQPPSNMTIGSEGMCVFIPIENAQVPSDMYMDSLRTSEYINNVSYGLYDMAEDYSVNLNNKKNRLMLRKMAGQLNQVGMRVVADMPSKTTEQMMEDMQKKLDYLITQTNL